MLAGLVDGLVLLRGLGLLRTRLRLGGRRTGRSRALRPPHCKMPEDAVRDAEDARDLVQHLGVALEQQQVVRALALVVDLVSELSPSPDVVPLPGAVAALDRLARARDDLVLPILLEVRVEQQNLVVVHVPDPLPSVWSAPPGVAARVARREAKQEARRV